MRRLVATGAGLQLAGLGVDARLHAYDPGLSAREGPLSLDNAGHLLLVAGLVAVVVAAFLLLTPAGRPAGARARRRRVLVVPAVGAIVLGSALGASATVSHSHGPAQQAGEEPLVASARARAERILPGLHHGHDDGAGQRVDPPMDAATRQRLAAELVRARATALRYPTVADAEATGFAMVTPYVPLVGAHYLRMDLFAQGFDPARPAILLYDGNDPRSPIVGVSYYVRATDPPEGFAGPADRWHRHLSLCLNDESVVIGGDGLGGDACRRRGGHQLDGTDGWMLHAWVVPGWDSPQGVFSSENQALL